MNIYVNNPKDQELFVYSENNSKHFGSLLSNYYFQASSFRQFIGRRKNHLKGKLITFADERISIGDKMAESRLKQIITTDKGRQPLQEPQNGG